MGKFGEASTLVYDASGSGHRANYVAFLSRLLAARSMIGSPFRALGALLSCNYLILSTFETAPLFFLFVLALRSVILRKKSCVIFLRAHIRGRAGSIKNFLRSRMYGLIFKQNKILCLSIVPVPDRSNADVVSIEDFEFWDLSQDQLDKSSTEISIKLESTKEERKVILVAGYLQTARGVAYLCEIFRACPEMRQRFTVAFAGLRAGDIDAYRQDMADLGVVNEERFLSDEELLSLYAVSDIVWCCFAPDRDMSSGVFGRSIQFGLPSIVRAGSQLEAMQEALGSGIAIPWDEPSQAADLMLGGSFTSRRAQSRYDLQAERVRSLIHQHAVGAEGKCVE